MLEINGADQFISNTIRVAMEPHAAHVHMRRGFSRVNHCLVVRGNLRNIMRRPPAASLRRDRRRHPRLISRRLCQRSACPSATKLRLRACPTITEPSSMFCATAVKQPTEGTMLRAGNGTFGDYKWGLCPPGATTLETCVKTNIFNVWSKFNKLPQS